MEARDSVLVTDGLVEGIIRLMSDDVTPQEFDSMLAAGQPVELRVARLAGRQSLSDSQDARSARAPDPTQRKPRLRFIITGSTLPAPIDLAARNEGAAQDTPTHAGTISASRPLPSLAPATNL